MGVLQQAVEPKISATQPEKERLATYGNRPDGSPKGAGYYGEVQNPYKPGEFSTELTIGVTVGGKPMDIPVLVPGLTTQEIRAVLKAKGADDIPESAVQKAVAHAKLRMQSGKSPYADPGEYHPLPNE